MIVIRTNISEASSRIRQRILSAQDKDKMLRLMSSNALAEISNRIHVDGKDASGSQIGTYSPGYMSVRTGKFKSNERITKGRRKGEIKTTGVFTKGKNKGQPRPNYNKTDDTTVVGDLTGWMRTHFVVIAQGGRYGLGFLNDANPDDSGKDNAPTNFEKARFLESTYDKVIYDLTDEERKSAKNTVKRFITDALHG